MRVTLLGAASPLDWLRPMPRSWARAGSVFLILTWVVQMAALSRQAWARGEAALATDLARYSTEAHWRGVYSRGDKIGFTVSQVRSVEGGYELQEDARLQFLLLGSTATVKMSTVVRVDAAFELENFRFSLDPGTGPMSISGRLQGLQLSLAIENRGGRREETRTLHERPVLSLNLPRRLVALGLEPGRRHRLSTFDPATLTNAPMDVLVGQREVIWVLQRPTPAFRLTLSFLGVATSAWITDLGEIVKEESPLGMLTQRETRERALDTSVSQNVRGDLIEVAAVPVTGLRLDDPSEYDRVRLRMELPPGFDGADLDGDGQTRDGAEFSIVSANRRMPGTAPADLSRFLVPEPFIESDAAEIVSEARRAIGDAAPGMDRARRLNRHVNYLVEKRPTVSLPSAVEVLRTRVGDCNEHTVLLVALARAAGIPARIAVGLVHLRGAFYYHAWAELWVAEPDGRGLWIPADPTLGQFPADPSHVRLARGGLTNQARILTLLGQTRIELLEAERGPGASLVVVGGTRLDRSPVDDLQLPRATGGRAGCWSRPSR